MSASEQEPEQARQAPPEGWVPAFPGQRPPLQPGHELTLRHGAYSPRKVDPLARELVDELLADDMVPGYVKSPVYRLELWGLARATAQVQLLSEYLEQAGTKAEDGVGDLADERVRAAYLALHRAEARAASARTRLGLTPAAAARLGKDVAQAAQANAAEELTRLREQHERATGQEGGDGDDG